MRRIRRLAAAMAIAAAGLTLAPAAIGSVSAWGDGTICYAGQTYTFDNEPAYYAFLDAHPGAIEGTCATTTTTAPPPPPSSTTTTLPDVDETTTTTAPPEDSTTTTAPADDTTTTTVAVGEPPVPPAHAVADLCGEIRIDLSGYQAGDALTVVTDDGTFVTLIDESGALRISYLSTQHYRVTVAAEPGAFDTGTRDSYCYVPPTTGEPATPIIHDEPSTTSTTTPAVPAPAAPPSPGLPETGFPIGGTLAAGTGALLAGIGLTRLNARRRPRTA